MPQRMAYDPYVPQEVFDRAGVRRASLKEVLSRADVISLHSPAIPETYHMINVETIGLMERQPVLVNTSRGKLIDTTALIDALRTGAISAAGLDVLESEPQVPADLLALDNVIITPHAAWQAMENEWEVRTRAVEDLIRVVQGQPPRNPVP